MRVVRAGVNPSRQEAGVARLLRQKYIALHHHGTRLRSRFSFFLSSATIRSTSLRSTVFNWRPVEKVYGKIQKIYQAIGATERVSLKWGNQGHRFYQDLRWPFIDQGLKRTTK